MSSEIGRRLNTLSSMEYKIQTRPRITILRISFVQSNNVPTMPNILFRSFYPMHNCSPEGNGYETLNEAQDRVKSWLQTTGRYFHSPFHSSCNFLLAQSWRLPVSDCHSAERVSEPNVQHCMALFFAVICTFYSRHYHN